MGLESRKHPVFHIELGKIWKLGFIGFEEIDEEIGAFGNG